MKKLLYIGAIALMVTGCKDDVQPGLSEPGSEVSFRAVSDEATRTIYGAENEDGTAIAVNWVSGDVISVYTPQGGSYKLADYSVNIGNAESQNFANSLDKVQPNGVHWAESGTSDFYAVYPNCEITESAGTVVAHPTIAAHQAATVPNGYTVGADKTYKLTTDMHNAFMYAQTKGVDPATTKEVDLRFIPYSTVLDMNFSNGTKPIIIRSVELTAPQGTNINGDFDVTFGNGTPTIAAAGNNSNTTTVYTYEEAADGQGGSNITLQSGEKLNVKLFIIPTGNMTLTADWSITVRTDAGVFVKNLSKSDGLMIGELKAGQIHKLTFPKFDAQWTFKPEMWMQDLVKNYSDQIYVSELTLPGAWYAYDYNSKKEGYQSATITDLFAKGIRAFQMETKVGRTDSGWGNIVANQYSAQININAGTVVLSGTGNNQNLGGNDQYKCYINATEVKPAIDAIINEMANYPEEFAVIALSYADGGVGSSGSLYKQAWLGKLKTIIDGYSDADVYKTAITPETTYADVKGKVIILVTLDDTAENNNTYPTALMGWASPAWTTPKSAISPMLWGKWPGNTQIESIDNIVADNLYLNYTLANRTLTPSTSENPSNPDGLPTMAQRINAIENLINNSDAVYGKGTHNVWYYVGAGGTTAPKKTGDSDSGSTSTVANSLNPFLYTTIQNKINNNKPSPLGLVFFNLCTQDTKFTSAGYTSCTGPELIKLIVSMNWKFVLGQKGVNTGGGGGSQQVNAVSAKAGFGSGFKVDANGYKVF